MLPCWQFLYCTITHTHTHLYNNKAQQLSLLERKCNKAFVSFGGEYCIKYRVSLNGCERETFRTLQAKKEQQRITHKRNLFLVDFLVYSFFQRTSNLVEHLS
jgi:hypothetical protein